MRPSSSSVLHAMTPHVKAHPLAYAEVGRFQRVITGSDVFEVPDAGCLDWFLYTGIDHVERPNYSESKNRKFNVAAKSVVRPKRLAADPLASRDPWRD